MKISVKDLRRLIVRLVEAGGGTTVPKQEPYIQNSLSPDINHREQLGSLADRDIDTEQDDELPPHLREPIYDEEECFGPVPPDAEDPYVGQDPFVRDYGPLPTPPVRR